MKALLITENFPPRVGGSGRWFRELYSRFPPNTYWIAAGTVSGDEVYDQANPLSLTRIPLIFHNRGIRGLSSFKEYREPLKALIQLAKTHQVQTIHCARCLPEGILGLGLRLWGKHSYICYAHGEELTSASLSREQSFWTRLVLFQADMIVANSWNTRQILQNEWNVPETKVCVLHPGVDVQKFRPAVRDEYFRTSMEWTNRFVLLTVGRLQRRKGHDRMIEAISLLRQKVPSLLYSIVGAGDEMESLKQLTSDLDLANYVQFLGEVSDEELLRCYQQCDLFVLPNREFNRDIEGFGMVLIEAQACGRPVLSGRSGGTSETMVEGVTGYSIDCADKETIARNVLKLIEDEEMRNEMSERARSFVESRFDWSVLTLDAKRILNIDEQVERVL